MGSNDPLSEQFKKLNNGIIVLPLSPTAENMAYYTYDWFGQKLKDYENNPPNYVFFYGKEDLENRIVRVERLLGNRLQFAHQIDPSLLDMILHILNPKHNINLTSFIYKKISKIQIE